MLCSPGVASSDELQRPLPESVAEGRSAASADWCGRVAADFPAFHEKDG
jgi:hypothetical protein